MKELMKAKEKISHEAMEVGGGPQGVVMASSKERLCSPVLVRQDF